MKRVSFILRKNHFVFEPIKDLSKLIDYLRSSKSIYVRSFDRVMPCKFFLGRCWLKSKRFADMFVNEDFFPVILKTESSIKKINQLIRTAAHNDWVRKQIFLKRKQLGVSYR